jgi:hypothetical protein
MKKILHIIIISIFSLTVISCAKKDESTSSSSSSGTTTDNTTTLSAPSGVSAKLGYYQVAVDWTAVSGASSYTVYWGSSTGITSSSTAITGITDDNYTHSSLDNGTKYYYRVATVNSAGTGSLSSEVNATPRDAPTVTEACTDKEIASGTVQGVTRTGPSGTFYHTFYGASPSNGCINADNITTVFGSSNIPSGTLSVKHALVITGGGYGFTDTWHYYSDTACALETGFTSFSYGPPLATSDNITISSPTSGYPAVATKVIYKNARVCALAETAAVETMIEAKFGGDVDLTIGTVFDSANDPDNNTNIWAVLDNITGQTINWFYTSSALDNGAYPNNWSSTIWHAGDNITR